LAENSDAYYVAYVSEQNLEVDQTGDPVEHPQVPELFGELKDGVYANSDMMKPH
jgi:heat shock protein HspQ